MKDNQTTNEHEDYALTLQLRVDPQSSQGVPASKKDVRHNDLC